MSEGQSDAHVGVLIVALWAVGIGGIIAAFFPLYETDWGGAGLCLVASALAFGQLLNARARK